MITVEFRITVTEFGTRNDLCEVQLREILDGFSMDFSVYGKRVQFTPYIKKEKCSFEHWEYYISMIGELPFTIKYGHVLLSKEGKAGLFDMVDDLVVEELEPAAIGYVLALMISYPTLNVRNSFLSILVDGEKRIEKFCSENGLVNKAAERYGYIMQTHLSVQQVWNWISANTDLYKQNDSSPVIFSAISYVFNRTYPEVVFYAMQGLEAELVAPNSRSISKDLQKAIGTLFPYVPAETVRELYKRRSNFAHGDVPLENILVKESSLAIDEEYCEDAELASVLILETLRWKILKS